MPGVAPSWEDEPTQREIALLSTEKNGQDRCWPATLHLNCFSVQKRRPVVTDLAAYRHRLRIDTTSCRMVALGELTSSLAPIRALLPEEDLENELEIKVSPKDPLLAHYVAYRLLLAQMAAQQQTHVIEVRAALDEITANWHLEAKGLG